MEDTAACSSWWIWYEFVVLDLVSVLIGHIELIDGPGVLGGEGLVPSWDNGDGEVIEAADSFPKKKWKLVDIVVGDQFHLIQGVGVIVEHVDGGVIIDMREDDEMVCMQDSLVLLILILL